MRFFHKGNWTMVDVVKYEARPSIPGKAAWLQRHANKGIENERREASGIGAFVLIGQDGAALHTATLDDIAKFFSGSRRVQKQQLH
jgi:hypothetical protein